MTKSEQETIETLDQAIALLERADFLLDEIYKGCLEHHKKNYSAEEHKELLERASVFHPAGKSKVLKWPKL